MHKVKRNETPKELKEKNEEFKKMDISKIDTTKEWKRFTATKVKKETLKSLQEMYGYCCAYCEAEVESTASGHIEHLKPKSLFPAEMFNYKNMHYSCPKCNINKKEKYDERMIDPSKENPEKHIYFRGTTAKSYDERGNIMIEIFQINDSDRTRRKTVLFDEIQSDINDVTKKYKKIDKMSKDYLLDYRKQILKVINNVQKHSKHGSEYCTMCKQNFKKSLEILKEITKDINKLIKNNY